MCQDIIDMTKTHVYTNKIEDLNILLISGKHLPELVKIIEEWLLLIFCV